MDMDEFIEAVKDAGYNYDGQGVTVEWSPSSGCWQNHTTESDNCYLKNHEWHKTEREHASAPAK